MFKKIKSAYQRFLGACEALTEASREQTEAIRAHTGVLREVAQGVQYLADAERRKLQRAGQPHQF